MIQFLGLFLLILANGCGWSLPTDSHRAVDATNSDSAELRQFYDGLLSLPATPSISPALRSEFCEFDDPYRGRLTTTFVLEQSNALEFIESCKALYACSPSARAKIAQFDNLNENFRITVVDFDSIPGRKPVRNPRGLYIVGHDRIFLQSQSVQSMKELSEACSIALHEMTHRYEHSTAVLGQTLQVEFPAYYNQYWFEAEIQNRHTWERGEPNAFASAARAFFKYPVLFLRDDGNESRPLRRSALAQWIARSYGLQIAPETLEQLVNSYPAYPWE